MLTTFQSVCDLKKVVISELSLEDIPEGGRLRVDDDNYGLRPPRKYIVLVLYFSINLD